jgi:hypothetical protein
MEEKTRFRELEFKDYGQAIQFFEENGPITYLTKLAGLRLIFTPTAIWREKLQKDYEYVEETGKDIDKT